jgi:tetratricopeptide (TPR) repeat protein
MANKKGFGYSFSLDNSDFKKGCKEIQQTLDKTFGKSFMSLSNGAMTALAGITAALTGLGAAAMAMGEKLDSALTGLKGLWGTVEKATEQYERLKTISENSMFGIDALSAVDRKLSALGVSAEESATILTRLGNTVVGVGGNQQTLDSLADALVKIKTTGQATTRSLTEFAKAGIKVDDLIGGSASDAVNKLIERMKKFDGVMKEESTDIWIQYKRVVKIAEDALAQLGNYINDNFKVYVVALVDKISELRDSFVSLLNDKEGMQALTKHLTIFASVITTVALPAMARLAIGFAPVIKSALTLVATIGALVAIVEDLTDENSLLLNSFTFVVLSIKKTTIQIKDAVGELLDGIITSSYNTFVSITNYAIRAANKAIELINKLLKKFFGDWKEMAAKFMDDLSVGATFVGKSDWASKLDNAAAEIRKGMDVKINIIPELDEKPLGEITKAFQEFGDTLENVEAELEQSAEEVDKAIEKKAAQGEWLYEKAKSLLDFSNVVKTATDNLTGIEAGKVGNITVTGSGKNNGANNIDPLLQKTDLWDRAKQLWGELKNTAMDYYTAVSEKAIQIYKMYEERQEQIKAQKKAFKEWTDDIEKTLGEGLQSAFKNALASSDNFFHSLGESLEKLGKQILAQIGQMMILTALFRWFNISSGSFAGIHTVSSWKYAMMNDGIVQNGKIITTHPDDYIVATKDPSSLGGKANVVINVQNNTTSQVSADSFFDGTKEIINIVIDGINRNVNGLRTAVRGA